MTQRTLKLHGSLTILCLGFVASMAACLGDDSTEGPTHDAAADHAVTADSTTTPDNSSPRPDSAPDTSVTLDAGRDVSVGDSSSTPDGGGRDSTPEATTADARDSAPEAARESGPDSTPPVEASPGDARVDQVAESAAPEAATPEAAPAEASIDATPEAGNTALHMCPRMDEFAGTSTDAGACADFTGTNCPDRATNWADPITGNFTFFGPIQSDCRIVDLFSAPGSDFGQFTVDLTQWTLGFFGCPSGLTPNPLGFGLVVTGLQDTVLTTADLRLLSDYYLIAVDQTLSDLGAPALTPTEISQMNARLDELAATRPNTVPGVTYTFSSCPADAGGQ